VSDEAGQFTWSDAPQIGKMLITSAVAGYEKAAAEVNTQVPRLSVILEHREASSVHLLVLDSRGEPVQGAIVFAGGKPHPTDVRGAAVIDTDQLRPPYRSVFVVAKGYGPVERTCEDVLKESTTSEGEVVVVLPDHEVSIRGVVSLANTGLNPAEWCITIDRKGGRILIGNRLVLPETYFYQMHAFVRPTQDGSFVLSELSSCSYDLIAYNSTTGRTVIAAGVRPHNAVSLQIDGADAHPLIRGVLVVGEDPLPRAEVVLSELGYGPATRDFKRTRRLLADLGGSFQFENLTRARYQLTVVAPDAVPVQRIIDLTAEVVENINVSTFWVLNVTVTRVSGGAERDTITIEDDSGNKLPLAQIRRDPYWGRQYSEVIGQDGCYRFVTGHTAAYVCIERGNGDNVKLKCGIATGVDVKY
jgi:hypothetical protein